jgi:branched-chain amino acid transport system substrate-binding protein
MKTKLWILWVLLFLAGCGEPEPIRLGFIGGLTGRYADFGTPGRNAALLAVEIQNQRGGINGRKIELLVRDDKQDPELARQIADDFQKNNVKAIIGPMFSSMGVAILPKINQAHILTIGVATTTTQLAGQDDYFFRVIGTTDVYAKFMARYHYERLAYRRTALVIDISNSEYTETFAREYGNAFTLLGGKVVVVVQFDSRQNTDYLAIVQQLLKEHPDNIAIASTSMDAALIAQSVRKLDPTVPMTGTGFAATERLIELGGLATEGMLVEHFADRFDISARYLDFLKKYIARFGLEPSYTGILSYDAALAVFAALEKDPEARNLKETLSKMKRFDGLQGEIVFDEFGDAMRTPYLSAIRNGRFVPLE